MRPNAIVTFEWLYLSSLVLIGVDFALAVRADTDILWAENSNAIFGNAFPSNALTTHFIAMALSLLICFYVSRKAVDAARWILVLALAIELLTLPFFTSWIFSSQALMVIVTKFIQIAAVYFLFKPESQAWFKYGPGGVDPNVFE